MCYTVAMMYLGIYNLLNFPAGVVPVTRVTAEDVRKDMQTFPAKDMWHKAMKKVNFIQQAAY